MIANGLIPMVMDMVTTCRATTRMLVHLNGVTQQALTFPSFLRRLFGIKLRSYRKFGCIDTDGDGFYDFADDLPDDARDYIDADGDSVGFSQDYNDSNRLVQTVNDHCELLVTDVTETCQGLRDANYQNYVANKEAKGESVIDYFAWVKSQEEAEE